MSRPVVIIPCDTKVIEGMTFDAVGRKYSAAVAEVADCQPLLAPLGPSMLDMGALLDIADGILLSGAISNVHPSLYGLDEPPLNENALDHERDSLTLPLVREALNRKLPLFAICASITRPVTIMLTFRFCPSRIRLARSPGADCQPISPITRLIVSIGIRSAVPSAASSERIAAAERTPRSDIPTPEAFDSTTKSTTATARNS